MYTIVDPIGAEYCEAFYRIAMSLQVMVSMSQPASCAVHINSRVFHTQVIVLYDTLLTFSREVKCIWKRKWSVATALFILIRYSAVVLCILNLFCEPLFALVRPVIIYK